MARLWVPLALAMTLSACGVVDTGATAAAQAESAAQQAAQAQAAQERVRGQIDAAYDEAERQRRAAEKDGQ